MVGKFRRISELAATLAIAYLCQAGLVGLLPPVALAEGWVEQWIEKIINSAPPLPKKTRGSRPLSSEVCWLSPSGESGPYLIWNPRPMMIWEGAISQIEVVDGSGTVLWRYKPQPDGKGFQQVPYDGSALKAGGQYTLNVYPVDDAEFPLYRLQVAVLATDTAKQFESQLHDLDRFLVRTKVDPAKVMLAKIQYFTEHQLWSEAINIVLSDKSNSEKIVNYRQKLKNNLCPLVK